MAYVLIVDDDELFRTILSDKLNGLSISVKQATNGLEGLEAAKQERPAVIVLDEHMPKMDGQQFMEVLQKEPWFKEVRIIVFTSLHSTDLMTHKRLAGVKDYLDKTTTPPDTVVQLVQQYMQTKSTDGSESRP